MILYFSIFLKPMKNNLKFNNLIKTGCPPEQFVICNFSAPSMAWIKSNDKLNWNHNFQVWWIVNLWRTTTNKYINLVTMYSSVILNIIRVGEKVKSIVVLPISDCWLLVILISIPPGIFRGEDPSTNHSCN